jgi:hypothetical protein
VSPISTQGYSALSIAEARQSPELVKLLVAAAEAQHSGDKQRLADERGIQLLTEWCL